MNSFAVVSMLSFVNFWVNLGVDAEGSPAFVVIGVLVVISVVVVFVVVCVVVVVAIGVVDGLRMPRISNNRSLWILCHCHITCWNCSINLMEAA